MTEPSTGWHLDDITYSGGTRAGPRASVRLFRAEEQVHAEGSGTGLIDAVPEPSACTCSLARESFTLARGPSRVPPEYVMSSSCQPVDGSVMRCPLMSS